MKILGNVIVWTSAFVLGGVAGAVALMAFEVMIDGEHPGYMDDLFRKIREY